MTTFHIVEEGFPITKAFAFAYNLENAKDHVARLHKRTGKGYYIVQVDIVHRVDPVEEKELEDDCA